MRRLLTVFAIVVAPILAGVASAQDERAEQPADGTEPEVPLQEPEPEIPMELIVEDDLAWEGPLGGRIARRKRDGPAVFARMRDGVLELKSGDGWKAATLDECGTGLAEERDRHSLDMLKQGGTGLEEVEPGVKATTLCLSLDIDPAVPWQHVQWLVTIAAKQRYRRIELRKGSKQLLVTLPVDVCRCWFSDDAPPEPPTVTASIHLVGRKEKSARWDGADVMVPTDIRYKYGNKDAPDLAAVVTHLKTVRDTASEYLELYPDTVFFGEIKAGRKVPFGSVFDVMDAFASAEIESVELYGTEIPPKAVRQAKRLPYPAKNYGPD